MNFQEYGALGLIFRKHYYLNREERGSIKGLVKGTNRPHVPSPRPQHLQNSSLLNEIMKLWGRKDKRLSMVKSKEADTKPEPDTVGATCSDPDIDTTRLPVGYPVYKIGRAKRYFRRLGKLPPFVIRSRKTMPKLAVVPSTDGLRPENPTRFIELVLRQWDREHSFWTMDQNGRRYIVQHFARDGGRWQTWKRNELFSRTALAFSPISRPRPNQVDDSETESEASNELSDDQVAQRCTLSGRPLRSCVRLSTQSRDGLMTIDATTSAESKNLAKLPCISSPSVPSEVSEASDAATFLKGEKHNELPYRDYPANTGAASRQDAEPSPPNPPARTKARSQLDTTSTSTVALPKESQAMPVASSQTACAMIVPASAGYPNHLPSRLQPPAGAPVLAEYKGDRTKMKLYVETSGQIRKAGKKRLRTCNTIDGFFRDVSERCNITEASIATILVTFPWLSTGHTNQTILLDRQTDFARTVIHAVDNAPCWSNRTAECVLLVDIVQKPGWGGDHHQASLSLLSQH